VTLSKKKGNFRKSGFCSAIAPTAEANLASKKRASSNIRVAKPAVSMIVKVLFSGSKYGNYGKQCTMYDSGVLFGNWGASVVMGISIRANAESGPTTGNSLPNAHVVPAKELFGEKNYSACWIAVGK
jgi:hypothetical protein